jgi:ABC-type multidrug transport system fused ATPase/permease subunit
VIFIFLGILCALAEATVWPLFSLVFAEAIATVIDVDHKESSLALWCGLMVVIGGGNVVASYFRHFFTEIAGSKLTQHLRNTVFKFIIVQPAWWFDEKAHSQGWILDLTVAEYYFMIAGVLTEYLAHDTSIVRNILGDFVSVVVLSLGTVVFGCVIALYQCWQLALVVLGCIPLVIVSTMLSKQGGFRLRFSSTYVYKIVLGADQAADKAESDDAKLASTIAASSVQNARSVISLSLFEPLHIDFVNRLKHIASSQRWSRVKLAIYTGISQFVSMAIWSLSFWFAGKMVELEECSVPDVFSVCMFSC